MQAPVASRSTFAANARECHGLAFPIDPIERDPRFEMQRGSSATGRPACRHGCRRLLNKKAGH